jgi:hypothetical protein
VRSLADAFIAEEGSLVSGELASPTVRIPGRSDVGKWTNRPFALGLTLLVVFLAPGCATGSGSGSSDQTRDRRNVITREELAAIEETEDITVYEVIRRLHPQWLRGRGTVSFRLSTPVKVHLNGARIGDVEELRRFRVRDVQYIEHMDGPQATQHFGTGYERGVILVFGRAGS